MSYTESSLHVEIQNLKDALAASEKNVDRYARMGTTSFIRFAESNSPRSFTVATLSVELDNLRNIICHSCKKKLTSSNSSTPSITISAAQGSTAIASSVSPPLWRRVFQGRQRSRPTTGNTPGSIGPADSLAAPPNANLSQPVPSEPGAAHNLNSSQMTPHPGFNKDIVSSEQEPEPPKWSVVYHPEVKQALDLHLAHAFTYDSPVQSVKMSPDGQKIAIGLENEGKTFVNELRTGSSIWLVLEPQVQDFH